LLSVRNLKKVVWLARENHHQCLVSLKFLGVACGDFRSANESLVELCLDFLGIQGSWCSFMFSKV